MELVAQVKKIPESPGVYFFLDQKKEILYVGRAVSLRRRVMNYTQKHLDSRLAEMMEQAVQVKYQETDNLLEAVILEANLIKRHWPKYNIREKDNRSFVYLVISKDDYPRPFIIRQRELQRFIPQEGHIFGPYQSWSLLRNALRIIRRVFPYSVCQPFSGRPCFDYQLGLCPGLCIGQISKKDYQKNIRNIILLLYGQKKRLLKKLAQENPEKEKALSHLQDASLVLQEDLSDASLNRIEGYDISHLAGRETYGAMVVFLGSQPDKSQYRLFRVRQRPMGDDLGALQEVVRRRFRHREWPLPDLIVIDGGKPQVDCVFKVLKENYINIPLVGISKYQKDKLIFPAKTKNSLKELAESLKEILLKVRNEAHRFSLRSSRRRRYKQIGMTRSDF